jgi:hypothetical protein
VVEGIIIPAAVPGVVALAQIGPAVVIMAFDVPLVEPAQAEITPTTPVVADAPAVTTPVLLAITSVPRPTLVAVVTSTKSCVLVVKVLTSYMPVMAVVETDISARQRIGLLALKVGKLAFSAPVPAELGLRDGWLPVPFKQR